MYIEYQSNKYPCVCKVGATMIYSGLPEDFPAPVDGEIVLCADDGFEVKADNSADYLRQTFENGVLTLTNVPEPPEPSEPEPDPEPTVDERVAALEAQLAETDEVAIDLYEASLAQEAINAEQDEAIIEIYETMEGLING